MSKHYSYVVFDLDGTLMNTYPGVAVSFTKTEQELGLRHLSDEELRSVIGPALEDSFYRLYGLEGQDNQRALDVFNRLYATMEGAGNSPFYSGVADMLQALKDRGCKISIATMKPWIFTRICLEAKGASSLFDSVACYQDNSGVSKAQLILQTLQEMGGSPEETLMVGDTASDGRGAAQAGVDFAAVTWGFGFHSRADLEGINYVGCFDRVEDLAHFVGDNH